MPTKNEITNQDIDAMMKPVTDEDRSQQYQDTADLNRKLFRNNKIRTNIKNCLQNIAAELRNSKGNDIDDKTRNLLVRIDTQKNYLNSKIDVKKSKVPSNRVRLADPKKDKHAAKLQVLEAAEEKLVEKIILDLEQKSTKSERGSTKLEDNIKSLKNSIKILNSLNGGNRENVKNSDFWRTNLEKSKKQYSLYKSKFFTLLRGKSKTEKLVNEAASHEGKRLRFG